MYVRDSRSWLPGQSASLNTEYTTEKLCDIMPSWLVVWYLHWLSAQTFEMPVKCSRTVQFLPAKSWGWWACWCDPQHWCDEDLSYIEENCAWVVTWAACRAVSHTRSLHLDFSWSEYFQKACQLCPAELQVTRLDMALGPFLAQYGYQAGPFLCWRKYCLWRTAWNTSIEMLSFI
jgi:hypothetical protein